MSKVLVIGGGAAGMMAAISAAECGHSVSLYERNEKLGKKIYITGKGRCNITNASSVNDIMKNVVTNPKFLYSAFYALDSFGVIDMLERAGLRTKIERGNRVFPESDKSSDVIRTLQNELKRTGVKVNLNSRVKELSVIDGEAKGIILESGELIEGDSVIVATGGLSYQSTGSTGDGYRFAEATNHKVTATSPSLVPIDIKEHYCKDMQGLSLKNVQLSVYIGGKKVFTDFGEMLFTHFGISGPLVLSASAYINKYDIKNAKVEIDLKPALSEEQLDERLLREFAKNINKQYRNVLPALMPSGMVPVIIDKTGVDPYKQVNEISREERSKLLHTLKHFDLTVIGLRSYNEAVITRGGVSVKDVNPHTMESKLVKGLYFAGEVLDVDALTGGFNLQIAWSSGYLAGISVE